MTTPTGDALLDAIIAVLEGITIPPLADVVVGRPRTINQDRTAGVWYGGQLSDQHQEDWSESLADIGVTETFTVGIFWKVPDAQDLRTLNEADFRATLRAVAKAFHATQTLGGLVAKLRLGDCTAGIWSPVGGTAYHVVQLTLIADTFEVDELSF